MPGRVASTVSRPSADRLVTRLPPACSTCRTRSRGQVVVVGRWAPSWVTRSRTVPFAAVVSITHVVVVLRRRASVDRLRSTAASSAPRVERFAVLDPHLGLDARRVVQHRAGGGHLGGQRGGAVVRGGVPGVGQERRAAPTTSPSTSAASSGRSRRAGRRRRSRRDLGRCRRSASAAIRSRSSAAAAIARARRAAWASSTRSVSRVRAVDQQGDERQLIAGSAGPMRAA